MIMALIMSCPACGGHTVIRMGNPQEATPAEELPLQLVEMPSGVIRLLYRCPHDACKDFTAIQLPFLMLENGFPTLREAVDQMYELTPPDKLEVVATQRGQVIKSASMLATHEALLKRVAVLEAENAKLVGDQG